MTHVLDSALPVDPAILDGLARPGTATVHECSGLRGAMHVAITPLDPAMRACGTAVTVRCPAGDNLMLIKAVSLLRPGDLLVADMGRLDQVGPFGEVLAVECVARGAAGVVLSGAVRDSRAIVRLGLPVFSVGLAITGTGKANLGTVNHQVVCGGELVRPGDGPAAGRRLAVGPVRLPVDLRGAGRHLRPWCRAHYRRG